MPYRNLRWARLLLPLLAMLTLLTGSMAETASAAVPLDAATKSRIVETLAREIAAQHAVPETGRRTSEFLRDQLRRQAYADIADGSALAAKLTEDLQAVSRDKHLQVFYSADAREWVPAPPATDQERRARQEQERQAGSADNFGFRRAEILPGNIGHLEMTRLASPRIGGEAAHSAMAFLRHTDALILDLRAAGGGDQAMAALLMGYLAGPDPVLMSTSHYRSGRIEQHWSPPFLPSLPHPLQSKPLYILTSELTFSAGEYLPFVLKSLGRATLVGETTGGGAYGGHTVPLSPHFAAWISIFRPIVPGVQGDWEGQGVTAHMTVPAEHALMVAQADILAKRAATLADGAERSELEWASQRLLAETNPVLLTDAEVRAYVGTYGDRVVTLKQERLQHRRGSGVERRLIPVGPDTFALEGYDPFRLTFVRDHAGTIIALEGRAPGAEPHRQPRQPSS